ncbi:MAG: hypothetical protein ABI855_11365, partial [Bacteroidota bacterium]
MKKYLIVLLLLFSYKDIYAQTENAANSETLDLKDLAVPTSPAFLLMDVGSTSIESPVNPKEFALGLVQNFDRDNKWFNDYSLEFTPYWWVKPGSRSAYDFIGLSKHGSANYEQNYFSGLKFTSISLAFINKDMTPDSVDLNQKIFSLGARTTILKIRNGSYADELNVQLKNFHDKILQKQLDTLSLLISSIVTDPALMSDTARMNAKIAEVTKKFQEEYYLKNISASDAIKEMKNIIEEKPLLNFDIAGALSQYGIGDTVWKTGRVGCWATLSSY